MWLYSSCVLLFSVQPPFDRIKKEPHTGSASASASPSGSNSKIRARTSSSPKKVFSSPDKQRLARPGASKQKRQKSPASLTALKRDATEESVAHGDVTYPSVSASREGILAQLVNEQVLACVHVVKCLPPSFTSRVSRCVMTSQLLAC